MKGSTQTALVLVIGAIAGIGLLAYIGVLGGTPAANYNISTNVPTGSTTGGQVTVSTSGGSLTAGEQLTVTVNHRDALTEGALTETTNAVTRLLTKTATGSWTVVTSGSGQTLTMGEYDDGIVYVTVEAASGQSYALSLVRTQSSNGGKMVSSQYVDSDSDGNKEWVLGFSTSGLKSQVQLSGTKPDLAINLKWYNENTVTLNSPSDISSIGTTAGTSKFIEWTLTGTAGDATLLQQVQLKLNSTTTSKWDRALSYIEIAGVQYSLAQFDESQDGTNTYYKLKFGYDQSTSKIVEFPNNGYTKSLLTTKMVWNLASGNVITSTMLVDTFTEADGSNTQVTDAVNNSA